MEKLISAVPLSGYRVRVTFADGFLAVVEITPFIRNGMSKALLDVPFSTEYSSMNLTA